MIRSNPNDSDSDAVVDQGIVIATRHRGNSSNAGEIVRNIASFLTLSDAASLYSFPIYQEEEEEALNDAVVAEQQQQEEDFSTDSWAVGEGYEPAASLWDVTTPVTPGLIALSPGATPRLGYDCPPPTEHLDMMLGEQDHHHHDALVEEGDEEREYMEMILAERRKRWAQQKLAQAVFAHPSSLRSYCLDAYQTAVEIRHRQEMQQKQQAKIIAPELHVEPIGQQQQRQQGKLSRRSRRRLLVNAILDFVLHNLPVSILIDILEAVGETSLDTTFASYRLTVKSLNAIVRGIIHVVTAIWDFVANFNPFQLLETVVSFQFNAMEKTSEALATGIQSVATGVGSASSMALHRLSTANLSSSHNNYKPNHTASTGSLLHHDSNMLLRGGSAMLNKKLLKKLSSINDAARVVRYMESEDITGGLSKQARTKVQRMMHYDVSLRSFVATVEIPMAGAEIGFGTQRAEGKQRENSPVFDEANNSSSSFSSDSFASPSTSPFMCTPQSFPPTPHSRSMVMARGSRFADDVVYLARDRLRLHAGDDSENEKTRGMAKALREGKRLAVFNANDLSSGVELSCGFHIATKVGNMLYASARSMVPVLRNCFVYFEMTVLPRSVGPVGLQQTMMTTLSIGLSTEEMPNNTLVGAWQGSCGLCTTGQILVAGQWCTPANPTLAAFTDGATVGCLVCLDDESAVDTWEGLLVTATVTFNVNGLQCSPMVPPATRLPFGQQASLPKKTPNTAALSDGGQAGIPTNESPAKPAAQVNVDPSPSPDLPLLVPAAEELYPTVTLHSPGTSVLCRFSAEDILADSREAIGAPPEACVYAVDGSVIFGHRDSDDESPPSSTL